ncbi:hypothetical protein F4780DRAFT_62366 [Xylariomycetidae sp. FL0641]|nr:hypothetical protein F4780DRAFT_62366 [Xylariomycetidae sp. FL0641]
MLGSSRFASRYASQTSQPGCSFACRRRLFNKTKMRHPVHSNRTVKLRLQAWYATWLRTHAVVASAACSWPVVPAVIMHWCSGLLGIAMSRSRQENGLICCTLTKLSATIRTIASILLARGCVTRGGERASEQASKQANKPPGLLPIPPFRLAARECKTPQTRVPGQKNGPWLICEPTFGAVDRYSRMISWASKPATAPMM